MQTTIQLDETLLDQATKPAQAKGCDLSHFIEETLRDKIAPERKQPQPMSVWVGRTGQRAFECS